MKLQLFGTKKLSSCFLLLSISGTVVPSTFGQENLRVEIRNENNCEANSVDVNYILSFWNKNSYLIFVARLGDGEQSSKQNLRRLASIKTAFGDLVSKDKLVLTQGERTKGRGQVEVYVNGQLFIIFTVGKNEGLRIGNCVN
jgi:hypothetical protein